MLVLSDEPKALVLACENLLSLSSNIRKLHSVDTLAMDINRYVRQMRGQGKDFNFVGTAGYYIFMFVEDGIEEVKIMLNVADLFRYAGDDDTQQFVMGEGPMTYDESCPADWIEEDGAN